MLDFIMLIMFLFAMMATFMIVGEMIWEGWRNAYLDWKEDREWRKLNQELNKWRQ